MWRELSGEKPALLELIVATAHRNGVRVVAEGVETAAQSKFLRNAGFDGMQGYYYGKTISTYRTRLLEKMAMKNNSELTRYTIRSKLVD